MDTSIELCHENVEYAFGLGVDAERDLLHLSAIITVDRAAGFASGATHRGTPNWMMFLTIASI
jgi:hypothetical protein